MSQGERFGLYGGCWSVSQPNLWSLISPNCQYVDGRYIAKGWFRRTAFQSGFTLSHRSTHNHQGTNHTPLLFFACLHFQCWAKTICTTLTSRAIKKTLWTCPFSLCVFPTLQMAVSIHNNSVASFCEECLSRRVLYFHLTAPYITFLNRNPFLQNNSQLEQDLEFAGTTYQIGAFIHSPVLAQDNFSNHEFLLQNCYSVWHINQLKKCIKNYLSKVISSMNTFVKRIMYNMIILILFVTFYPLFPFSTLILHLLSFLFSVFRNVISFCGINIGAIIN